jgi:peroxiredoxin
MTPRLHAFGTLVAIALLPACKTTSGALPGWDDPEPGEGVAAAEVDEAGDAGGEPGSGAEPGAGEEGSPTAVASTGETAPTDPAADPTADPAAGSGTEPTAPTAADDGQPAAPEPEPAALPDPVYTKVDKKCGKDPGVGERLKAFDLPTSDGGKVTQGTYRGRVLVVNFWGTWCKPCLKELPEFDALYRRYRKHGMTLLAIATDEDATAVNEFKKKRRLAAKLAIGGEDYAGKYSSTQFPFTFVVDEKGVIKSSFRGYKPECMGKLEDDIRKELDKRAKARAG